MNRKLAIIGHPTRGKEVIELLEMMGGINPFSNNGEVMGNKETCCYYISENDTAKHISWDYIGPKEIDNYKIFTIEEFLEKYPFKIHDLVNIPEYESTVGICGMRWDSYSKCVEYMVYRNDDEEWYTAEELLNYNDKPSHDEPRHMYLFNPHDFVVVESYDKKQKWICEYKSYVNNQLHFYKGTYVIGSNEEENKNELIYNSYYDIAPSDIIRVASPGEITRLERMIEKHNTSNHMPTVLAELLHHIRTTPKEDLEKEFNELEEWSHVGPTVEEFMDFCNAVNKKPKYPTNYKECCELLSLGEKGRLHTKGYKAELIIRFQQLLICRDAYWKIAGEQMGLGKSWEPDWNWREYKFCIGIIYDEIERFNAGSQNCMLAFPTEEMRDAFYENFKVLIEQCKELL